jgi:primosomal protein N'
VIEIYLIKKLKTNNYFVFYFKIESKRKHILFVPPSLYVILIQLRVENFKMASGMLVGP